jgi:hypothetical protein
VKWLTLVLAGCYVLTWDPLGIVGAVLIAGSLFVPRLPAYILLVAGAVPLAVVTWWSIVTPLLAVMTLVMGAAAIREKRSRPVAGSPA